MNRPKRTDRNDHRKRRNADALARGTDLRLVSVLDTDSPIRRNREEFKATYDKKITAVGLRKAVRAEIGGGNDALDGLELFHRIRLRNQHTNPAAADVARLAEEMCHRIVDQMCADIIDIWELNPPTE
jgi:hypothetical protein